MKKSLKLRAVVSPTPAIIAAAYDENGKADACTVEAAIVGLKLAR